MKFSLFLHMERYDARTPHRQLFDELTELVQIAEKGGFETAWVGEHHAMEFTIAPNPFINLAYLAARTERIRLGTGTVIAPFWHPIRLAGEAGMVDVASNGRLDLGIARGAYSFEYERLLPGLDAFGAGARMRELVPALQQLFKGDYAHEGEFWSWPSTTPVPRPVQQPNPPMWLAARDPNSHEFAVRNGCHVQVTSLAAGDGEVVNLMDRFNAACKANPDVPRPQIMMLMHTFRGCGRCTSRSRRGRPEPLLLLFQQVVQERAAGAAGLHRTPDSGRHSVVPAIHPGADSQEPGDRPARRCHRPLETV
jgi:alkanesulfonate monooxygenase SsuD/methylene tetrahydromethanopterin reductase-like flavin-dependent oxidoreductase (luciferase family)